MLLNIFIKFNEHQYVVLLSQATYLHRLLFSHHIYLLELVTVVHFN